MPSFHVCHHDAVQIWNILMPASCPTQALLDYLSLSRSLHGSGSMTDAVDCLRAVEEGRETIDILDALGNHVMSAIDVMDTLERALALDDTPDAAILLCPKAGTHLLRAC